MAFASPSPITRTPSAMFGRTLYDNDVTSHMTRSHSFAPTQNFYSRNRDQVYKRFSKSDWESSNRNFFDLSDKERTFANRLRSDAWQTIKSIDQQTKNRQANNTKMLGERVADISFWKEELINEIRSNAEEMQEMKEFIRVVDQFANDTKHPLSVAEDCLAHREARVGIDQVNDVVEKSLIKEIDCIKRCQDKLKRLLEKAAAQQKMTRSAQQLCDQDTRNKHHAEGLDGRVQQLHNMSANIGLFPNIENYDNTISVPATWVKFTQENIQRSQRERDLSLKLRNEMDMLMRQCHSEMNSHNNASNNAFQTRVQELNDAKNKMQAHLQKTLGEIREMDRMSLMLRKAICDKELPLKVAQTRLEERTRRIDVELCNDPSMQGLQREVNEIKESIRLLKVKLKDTDNSLARLYKARSMLENDIATKERSIEIDSRSCLGLRKTNTYSVKVPSVI